VANTGSFVIGTAVINTHMSSCPHAGRRRRRRRRENRFVPR
jgi:hypothetical protein